MSSGKRPLSEIAVVDLGIGSAPALAVRLLADAGASVLRVEPEVGDPFYGQYAAYAAWQAGKTVQKASSPAEGLAAIEAQLASADVCVVGGEDWPELDWAFDAAGIAAAHPHLVVLSISGDPSGTMVATELMAQARTGLVFEQHPDRPMFMAMPAANIGAALQGSIAVGAALAERELSGKGQLVTTSLFEGALSWASHCRFVSERTDRAMMFELPKGALPLVFTCADGRALHFSFGTPTSRRDVYGILGIEDPTLEEDPRGMPSPARGIRNMFGDIDLLQSYIGKWNRDDLLERLGAVGVPAEPVNFPGEAWDDVQVRHNEVIVTNEDGVRRVGLPVDLIPHESVRATAKEKAGATPLAGMRIIDFGNFTAGPHVGMVLGDLGADVIKVEALTGDATMNFFRPYTASSRGKRTVALDMKHPEGRKIALQLCADADIVMHNFRPGVADRLGLGETALRAQREDVILLDNSGYGPDGPKALKAGFDMVFQAFCGHEIRAAGKGNPPTCYRLTTIDFAAGLLGAFAGTIGAYYRRRYGAGMTIHTSLINAGLFLLSEVVQRADGSFAPLPELNAAQTGFHPASSLYLSAEGWIAVDARDDTAARTFAGALSLSALAEKARAEWTDADGDAIQTAISEAGPSVADRLNDAGVWVERCNDDPCGNYMLSPDLFERGTVVVSQDERYGEMKQLGSLFRTERTPPVPRGNSPRLGQNTDEVLASLGYGADEIARLRTDGVIK